MKKKIFTIGLSLLMGLSVFASSPVAADAKGDVSEIEYVDIDNVKAGEDDWYNNLLYLNDEKKVPDENFRKYLKTFDTDYDDVLL